jgi:superfamily II DNA or RNA helicase
MQIMTELRSYQIDFVNAYAHAVAAGQQRIIGFAPTGSGKTVIASEIARQTTSAGGRLLVLAHRREIVHQTVEKLFRFGLDAGVILAGDPMRLHEPVQVASIQTLHARAVRGTAIELPPAELVILDEAHHCPAETYQKIIAAYPAATILGLTATPARADGRGLGGIFATMIECPQVPELIRLGFLVGTRVWAPTNPDLTGVTVRQGDYAPGELEQRMDRPQLVGDIAQHWHRHAGHRKRVVFASGVNHSIHLRDEFCRSGVLAEHLDGSTPKDERDAILKRLGDGDIEIVVNCAVLTEGFDLPDIGCIVLARPTKSMALYRQMIGRGLRPAPDKADLLVLDHAGATHRHGFAEDPVKWTLAPDRRAANRVHEARQRSSSSRLCDCPKCGALRTAGERCRACGYLPVPKPQHVEVIDGDLAQLDRKGRLSPRYAAPDERARWHAQLLGIARDRGYRPGWAAYKYREKFGEFPSWDVPSPMAPSLEVRAWVRSRQIAYAKAMAKRGAA